MKQRQRVKENKANIVEKEWLFDAIMLDYEMPTLSGLAIIRKIKDKFTKKNLPMPRVLLLASTKEANNYQKVWGNFTNDNNPIDFLINKDTVVQDLE